MSAYASMSAKRKAATCELKRQQYAEKKLAGEIVPLLARCERYRRKIRGARETWPMTAIHDSRRRAKNASIAHTITLADIYMPEHCPVLGIKLEFGQPRGCSSSPSLDRFDMSLGYVPGNVRVISRRANTLKNDATAAELRAVAAYAEGEL